MENGLVNYSEFAKFNYFEIVYYKVGKNYDKTGQVLQVGTSINTRYALSSRFWLLQILARVLQIGGQVFQNWVTLLQGRESNFKVRSLSKSREVTICKDLPQFVFMGRIQMRGMVQCNKFCYLNP